MSDLPQKEFIIGGARYIVRSPREAAVYRAYQTLLADIAASSGAKKNLKQRIRSLLRLCEAQKDDAIHVASYIAAKREVLSMVDAIAPPALLEAQLSEARSAAGQMIDDRNEMLATVERLVNELRSTKKRVAYLDRRFTKLKEHLGPRRYWAAMDATEEGRKTGHE